MNFFNQLSKTSNIEILEWKKECIKLSKRISYYIETNFSERKHGSSDLSPVPSI